MADTPTVNDNKPAPKQAAAPKESREGVRVRGLRFSRATGLEIPIDVISANELRYKQVNFITAGSGGDGETEIEFQPWSRRYRVTRKNKNGQAFAYSIPESWALHIE